MGFLTKLKNMIIPSEQSEEEQLLKFLGIDRDDVANINEATYFTCLKVLAETMGKLPLKYYHIGVDGGRERADPDEVVRVLLERPNPYMTPATFWGMVETCCNHYGNAYVWIQRRVIKDGKYGGTLSALYWPMHPASVQVLVDDSGIFGDKGLLYYTYDEPTTGQHYVFPSDDVMHFKTWLTWDGIVGKSVGEILKDTIQGAGQSQSFLNKLYEGGLTASSVLNYTGDIDEVRRKKLQARYNDILTGAKNAGKVVALPFGMSLQPLNVKLTDAQFFELRKYTALEIAAAFGVKPNQLNDYEKSSYANSESQQLAFLVDTMLYRITQYEQEINHKVLSEDQRRDNGTLKFNEKVILRTDATAQMNTITAAIQNGVYTPNEGRALLDLPSKDGGDKLIVNGNYIPLTMVGTQYER